MIKIDDVKKAIEKDGVYQVPNVDFELGIEPNDQQGDYEVFCYPHGVVRLADTLDKAVNHLRRYVAKNLNVI